MLLLSCHSCKCPLMYYHGGVYEVDDVEMDKLKEKEFKAVEGYRKILEPRRVGTKVELPRATHRMGQALRETSVNQDDLINLRIDLATCQDVNDFLEKL